MAHLKPIPTYKCQRCMAKAAVELINNHSSGIGYYCKTHGELALKSFLATPFYPPVTETTP